MKVFFWGGGGGVFRTTQPDRYVEKFGGGAVRSQLTGPGCMPKWVLKRILKPSRAKNGLSGVGYYRRRYLQTEHRYVTTPTYHT